MPAVGAETKAAEKAKAKCSEAKSNAAAPQPQVRAEDSKTLMAAAAAGVRSTMTSFPELSGLAALAAQ